MEPRIISLLPSATEIVAALGLTAWLVGRSHECDYPPSVRSLPACTAARLNSQHPSGQIDADVQSLLNSALSIYQIKIEAIDGLRPTHIITQDQCDVCAVSFSDVKKAVASLVSSHPQVISLQPQVLRDVWVDIDRVAQALGVASQPVLSQLEERIQITLSSTSQLSEQERPTVVALEWTDPLMGTGNWIPELIEMAGGKSVLGVIGQHSSYLSWNDLVEVNPDMIIVMPCGFDLERTRQECQVLSQYSEWETLRAVQHKKVFLTDGNAYFNRPGPRLVDSLEILGEIIHPELFDFGYRGQAWIPYG
jgi:iron complex transport system substrate-binding protein